MTDPQGLDDRRFVRRVVRLVGRVSRRPRRAAGRAMDRARFAVALARAPVEPCMVCGSMAARVVTITDSTVAGRRLETPRAFPMRICRVCGHVGNPENLLDYRAYDSIDHLADGGRIGTLERPGREFHMAKMAVDILGRGDLDVLIYGAGRSYDNHHIAALPQVRGVAIADIMQLRNDAEFIDANRPAARRFSVVVASEVVEHFHDPRSDFSHLLGFVEPDGLLVCGTNLYDGDLLSKQTYIFYKGHTSYFTPASLARIVDENGAFLDIRTPLSATGYAGPRKRYLLLTRSAAVVEATHRYFVGRAYAPSESPTANQRDAGPTPASSTSTEALRRGG